MEQTDMSDVAQNATNLRHVPRLLSGTLCCRSNCIDGKACIPYCRVCSPDCDQFRVSILGDIKLEDLCVDLEVELGPGVGVVVKSAIRPGRVSRYLWMAGNQADMELSPHKEVCREDEWYAYVQRLRFFNNKTGKTVVDCSALLGDTRHAFSHWIDLRSKGVTIFSVCYSCTMCTDILVDALHSAGLITDAAYSSYNPVLSRNWDLNMPLYSR